MKKLAVCQIVQLIFLVLIGFAAAALPGITILGFCAAMLLAFLWSQYVLYDVVSHAPKKKSDSSFDDKCHPV